LAFVSSYTLDFCIFSEFFWIFGKNYEFLDTSAPLPLSLGRWYSLASFYKVLERFVFPFGGALPFFFAKNLLGSGFSQSFLLIHLLKVYDILVCPCLSSNYLISKD
jgi:hypothetical protein